MCSPPPPPTHTHMQKSTSEPPTLAAYLRSSPSLFLVAAPFRRHLHKNIPPFLELSPWCRCGTQCDINITSFLTRIQKRTYTYFTTGVRRHTRERKDEPQHSNVYAQPFMRRSCLQLAVVSVCVSVCAGTPSAKLIITEASSTSLARLWDDLQSDSFASGALIARFFSEIRCVCRRHSSGIGRSFTAAAFTPSPPASAPRTAELL